MRVLRQTSKLTRQPTATRAQPTNPARQLRGGVKAAIPNLSRVIQDARRMRAVAMVDAHQMARHMGTALGLLLTFIGLEPGRNALC